ncbi:MAG: galactokinase [Acidobacteriaceae bacterium]|nr:galactokinase [Acidobacteriaceae bacterium]
MGKEVFEQEFIAPARVNLLGEHTDYTGGLVLPMAIPFQTIATIAPSDDEQYRFTSEQFPEERMMTRDDRSDRTGVWCDYPVGVLRQLQRRGVELPGFHLHLRGNVPFGAGVSSSASVEVATALAMLCLADKTMPPEQIALMCQAAENQYVHSPCGIMDQFVITMAKAGHALLLETGTLAYEHIPMNQGGMADTCIVVCNSMVKHSVASGEYGTRRKELEAGQAVICAAFPGVKNLGGATLEQLEACKDSMTPNSYRRCHHVISENKRVREAKEAMVQGDPARLGKLMVEAHASQRDDFECSCDEVDFLVDTAAALPGCYGARMTGGGFGGCTVNLVTRIHAESFAISLKNAYRKHLNIEADTFVCEAVDGAIERNTNRCTA